LPAGEIVAPDVSETYGVTSTNLCIPNGLVALIRRGDQLSAIRFVEVRRLNEDGTGYATYESYYRDDGRTDLAGTVKRLDTVSVIGWGGFHPFSYRKGDAKLEAGRIALDYNFPTCVSFTLYGRSPADHGVEIAPTRWRDIREVNAADPTLRWFKYDETGGRHLEIPRGDL
jgi:hypothetical protein